MREHLFRAWVRLLTFHQKAQRQAYIDITSENVRKARGHK